MCSINLPKKKIIKILKYITKNETLQITTEKADTFFELLFFISGGDLRKAINTLQMSVSLELLDNLELNEILRISGFMDEKTLEDLTTALKNKDFGKSREIIDSMESLDSRNFIRQLIEALPRVNIEPNEIPTLRSYIGEIDYRISRGASEKIQVSALLAKIIENIEI
jgi:replication factor C small subunit